MSRLSTGVLVLAAMSGGILAGFFTTYAFTIMPGLATTDDRTFVGAFQGLERMFGSFDHGVNWPPIIGYPIGVTLAVAAIALNRRRPIVWWITAAVVLIVSTFVTTALVNVPLNEDLSDAGDPAVIDVAQVRADFDEDRWRAWNLVRTTASVGAFGCLAWALVLRGRIARAS